VGINRGVHIHVWRTDNRYQSLTCLQTRTQTKRVLPPKRGSDFFGAFGPVALTDGEVHVPVENSGHELSSSADKNQLFMHDRQCMQFVAADKAKWQVLLRSAGRSGCLFGCMISGGATGPFGRGYQYRYEQS
jgi:hypothetical protein